MAKIVLGLASSHSTMAHAPAHLWDVHARGFDMNQKDLVGRDGKLYDYAGLLAQAGNRYADLARPEQFAARHERLQNAIDQLAGIYAEVRPDVAIIIGEDQHEVFQDDNMPALLVYWGKDIINIPRETSTRLPPEMQESMRAAAWGYGTETRTWPVAADLGKHIIDSLIDAEFDVAQARQITRPCGVGHAFGFVYKRIMHGAVPPHVPVMQNTFYPPNQMTPRRCVRLGRALRNAIESWPEDLRVAVIASGGLSHFVLNEELDQTVLDALARNDLEALAGLPRPLMNSGSSEILNWVTAAGMLEGLSMRLIDYVPCYRSPAGTGVGMGFAAWQ